MAKHRAIKVMHALHGKYPAMFKDYDQAVVDSIANGRYANNCKTFGVITDAMTSMGITPYEAVAAPNDEGVQAIICDTFLAVGVAPWRYGQSIYRFDGDLRESLFNSKLTGNLPCELLMRMPEWGVYVELVGVEVKGVPVYGFWASLIELKSDDWEIRITLDSKGGRMPLPISIALGEWSLDHAIELMLEEIGTSGRKYGMETGSVRATWANLREVVEPLLSMVLYICSDGVEYRGSERPTTPSPRRNRRFPSGKLFVPSEPRVWRLGEKTGNAIRHARECGSQGGSKAPHIRRAHWHSFWKGPRTGDRTLTAKFIPPVLVGVEI